MGLYRAKRTDGIIHTGPRVPRGQTDLIGSTGKMVFERISSTNRRIQNQKDR
jgi:hypothetical protein